MGGGGTATTHNPAAGVHNVSSQGLILSTRDTCDDSTGSSSDHPLKIVHEDYSSVVPLNGRIEDGTIYWEYLNWYPDAALGTLAHLTTSTPSTASDITKALALSNPSRATVSIPNFIYELKDLPGMYKDILYLKSQFYNLKNLPRYNPKVGANWFLAIKFGWIPLFNDIRRMLSFQISVDRKLNELERLYSNGGLKRRIKHGLGSDHRESTSFVVMDTRLGGTPTCKLQRTTSVERWATVRWKPTKLPKAHTPEDMRKLARRLVFGLDSLSAVQVWNAVPWSWLTDWFTNVGDFLQAHDNTVPAAPGPVNLMTRTESKYLWTRTGTFAKWSGGEGSATLKTLERTQGNASLAASLPLLSGGQLSILGALALQRMR